MKIHENKELFQDAVIATSQQIGIPEVLGNICFIPYFQK